MTITGVSCRALRGGAVVTVCAATAMCAGQVQETPYGRFEWIGRQGGFDTGVLRTEVGPGGSRILINAATLSGSAVWQRGTGIVPRPSPSDSGAISMSSDGLHALITRGGRLARWNIDSGEVEMSPVGSGGVGRISPSGRHVASWIPGWGTSGLRAWDTQMGTLRPLDMSVAVDIADDGAVAGTSYRSSTGATNEGLFAVIDAPGIGRTTLPKPAWIRDMEATGISADGLTVIGTARNPTGVPAPADAPRLSSWYWTAAGGLQPLEPLPGFSAMYPTGVSGDGGVITGACFGTSCSDPADFAAWIWRPGYGTWNLADLLTSFGIDLSGFQFVSANGVSSDGRTVTGFGYYTPTGGATVSGLFTFSLNPQFGLIPSPSTAGIVGLMGVVASRRRRAA